MLKTGILGGTFDPPHNAHIMMAVAAIEEAGLDRVILMPNGDPPHKKAPSGPTGRRFLHSGQRGGLIPRP